MNAASPPGSPVIVLGVNAAHDAAACLLVDGRLVVAVPEERLTRVKHAEGFPHRAVDYCLRAASLSLADVDCLAINEYPQTDYALELRDTDFVGELLVNPSHHLLHATYAAVASGFKDAAVLVLDGSGYHHAEYERRGSSMVGDRAAWGDMDEAESWFALRDGRLDLVRKTWGLWDATIPYYRFPSLGHMFSAASQYIFGHWQHAGKTMGLAPYGDASAIPQEFVELVDDGVRVTTDWVTRLPPRSSAPAEQDQLCRDLAAKVQVELERAVLHICAVLHAETGLDQLAISGGVALNSVANGKILRESGFSALFVTPAAADSGVAIGAALHGHHRMTRQLPSWDYTDDYHGRAYSVEEVLDAGTERAALLHCEPVDSPADRAAADIAAGRIIGWFEGGSEFGPRSLGHRSILCDARVAGVRDRLNEIVKYREPFRPYAASVLSEHAGEYFDIDVDDPFMLVVTDVHASRRAAVPSVCHVDHTCRVQCVPSNRQDQFRRLLERFYALTGTPLVLNTSFNVRGEPIVETPGDAMDCFLACNVEVLYVEGHRFTKATVATDAAPEALVPRLSESVSLEVRIASKAGAAAEPEYFVRSRTGYRAVVSAADFALLGSVDARRSIAEITKGDPLGVAAFAALQLRGLVAVERPARERA